MYGQPIDNYVNKWPITMAVHVAITDTTFLENQEKLTK